MATILLVKEDAADLSWQPLLIGQGHHIEFADQETSALEQMSQHPPALLICVSGSVKLDSLSLLQKVKSLPQLAAIFCILIAPLEQLQSQFQVITTLADDWIIDSASNEEVLWRIQSSLRTRHLAQSLRQESSQLQRMTQQLIQNEKMSSLGQMVSGIVHEINNPVSVIKGNVSHVSDYVQDLIDLIELYGEAFPKSTPAIQERIEEIDLEFLIEDLPQVINSMKTATERIRQLVQSLKNFYQLDDSEQKFIDIQSSLEDILLILQGHLKGKKGRRIQVIKDYERLPELQGYPGQLNQAFLNILRNAVEALESRRLQESSEEPTIWLQTKSAQTELNQPSVEIHIKDNGVGIPLEIQDRIFDPFFTTKPLGSGVGIGLDISHRIIVNNHAGKFTCSSQPGEGTEFTIILPLTTNRETEST
ncbi:MAG: sensor histidine kinase [Microcoleaceae cyanobacterium]